MNAMTVLDRRVVPQQLPPLSPRGDCGACVLGGLLGVSVERGYELAELAEPQPITSSSMARALFNAQAEQLVDRVITDQPLWLHRNVFTDRCFGPHPDAMMAVGWFRHLRMALDAGYYAITLVSMFGPGYFSDGYEMGDHWLMIVGAREVETKLEHGARTDREVLLSCSSTQTPDEEWIDASRFLRERGGFWPFFARPT